MKKLEQQRSLHQARLGPHRGHVLLPLPDGGEVVAVRLPCERDGPRAMEVAAHREELLHERGRGATRPRRPPFGSGCAGSTTNRPCLPAEPICPIEPAPESIRLSSSISLWSPFLEIVIRGTNASGRVSRSAPVSGHAGTHSRNSKCLRPHFFCCRNRSSNTHNTRSAP